MFLAAAVQTYWCQHWAPSSFLQSFSPGPPPSLASPILHYVPLLFVCLFKHRGEALGWRPLHLFWSGGHVNRGAPAGLMGPGDTPRHPPISVPPLASFYKEVGGCFGWHTPPITDTPAVAPGWCTIRDGHVAPSGFPGTAPMRGGCQGAFSFNLYSCRERALLKHDTDHTNISSCSSDAFIDFLLFIFLSLSLCQSFYLVWGR